MQRFLFCASGGGAARAPVGFGNDQKMPDGTDIRDYQHVTDLADAHLKAVDYAAAHSDRDVSLDIVGRRAGAVAGLTADPLKANAELDGLPGARSSGSVWMRGDGERTIQWSLAAA